jgi:arylsulfatase A
MILGHRDAACRPAGSSLRPGDMQLIKTAKLIDFELYDLRDDHGQEKDLAKTEPERLAKLKAML